MAPTVTCRIDVPVVADGIFLLRRQIGDTITMTVGGEIDLATAGHLAECLDPCVAEAGAQPVAVDLSEVTLLAAAGISVLVDAHHTARAHGGELRIVASSRPVHRPLMITGVTEVLAVYPTLEQALAPRAGH